MEVNFYVTEDVLASKNQRFLNHLIDLIPQYALIYLIEYTFLYIGEFTGNHDLYNSWVGISALGNMFLSYLLMFLYFFLMETRWSKSLGKYATKTIVVLSNGEKPSNKDIAIRSLCRMIPFDGLSFLGTNGKGWHDSLSKTYVVNESKFLDKKHTQIDLIGVHQKD